MPESAWHIGQFSHKTEFRIKHTVPELEELLYTQQHKYEHTHTKCVLKSGQ